MFHYLVNSAFFYWQTKYMKKKTSHKSDKQSPMQVRLEPELHRLLKIEAARSGRSLKSVLEECVAEYLGPLNHEN